MYHPIVTHNFCETKSNDCRKQTGEGCLTFLQLQTLAMYNTGYTRNLRIIKLSKLWRFKVVITINTGIRHKQFDVLPDP